MAAVAMWLTIFCFLFAVVIYYQLAYRGKQIEIEIKQQSIEHKIDLLGSQIKQGVKELSNEILNVTTGSGVYGKY